MAHHFITLAQLAELAGKDFGKSRLSVGTVYNWVRDGRCGVKLKTQRNVGTVVTTSEWYNDFLINVRQAQEEKRIENARAAREAAERLKRQRSAQETLESSGSR